MLRFPGDQHGNDRYDQQQADRHVSTLPADLIGDQENARAAGDQAEAIAERVGGSQGTLRFRRRDLDTICIHDDIDRRAGERGQKRGPDEIRQGGRGRHEGHRQQARRQQQQCKHQPAAALAEPAEQRQTEPVYEGRPEELEVVTEGDVARQADGAVVHARFLQPGRERVADQQERQSRGQSEEQHGDRTRLGECRGHAAQPFVAGHSGALGHSA
jgi:hypothetical protein